LASFMQAIPPPDRLWAWCPGVYHDEQGQVWVAVLRKVSLLLFVLAVRAEQVLLGDSWTRSQFPLSPLPHLWQWCPRGLYRAAGGIGEDEWWLESHQVVSCSYLTSLPATQGCFFNPSPNNCHLSWLWFNIKKIPNTTIEEILPA
uniref:Uncharacterized protein n=1 Tax=Terrapene triunguis TaxID=2587831 RepID=A0A674K8A1_9SAUR